MREEICSVCGQLCWWNPAALVYCHDEWRLDKKHRAMVLTNSYLDSPGMREAHRRSASGGY